MTGSNHEIQRLQLKDMQDDFEQIFEDALVSGGPVKILRDTGNAILVSDEIWRGVSETVNLVGIPGMRESIRSGMREHIADTATDLDW